jgi:glutaredoxin 2
MAVEAISLHHALPAFITRPSTRSTMLRGFSVVRDLHWPATVRRYVEQMAERSGVDTFFDRAS